MVDQGDTDLQTDQESKGRPVSVGSLEAGRQRSISRYRSRWRLGDIWADWNLAFIT